MSPKSTEKFTPWVHKELHRLLAPSGRVNPRYRNAGNRRYLLDGTKITLEYKYYMDWSENEYRRKENLPRRMLAAFSPLFARQVGDGDEVVKITYDLDRSAVNYLVDWMTAVCKDKKPRAIKPRLDLLSDLWLFRTACDLEIEDAVETLERHLTFGIENYALDYRALELFDELFNGWSSLKQHLLVNVERRRSEGKLNESVKRYLEDHPKFKTDVDLVAAGKIVFKALLDDPQYEKDYNPGSTKNHTGRNVDDLVSGGNHLTKLWRQKWFGIQDALRPGAERQKSERQKVWMMELEDAGKRFEIAHTVEPVDEEINASDLEPQVAEQNQNGNPNPVGIKEMQDRGSQGI
ncbi:hypothetical protein NpPPO83_00005549 [Neofusicoccum parvum]|uniref:Uncharacterized protein n=1 Tax=Neofusicoccum parvum TaxID=310453 RepID=A0ACB5S6Q1_9PEZI|nr:hypothetical protein NpPPO83_00005549 [Neofusicoccum parvum]